MFGKYDVFFSFILVILQLSKMFIVFCNVFCFFSALVMKLFEVLLVTFPSSHYFLLFQHDICILRWRKDSRVCSLFFFLLSLISESFSHFLPRQKLLLHTSFFINKVKSTSSHILASNIYLQASTVPPFAGFKWSVVGLFFIPVLFLLSSTSCFFLYLLCFLPLTSFLPSFGYFNSFSRVTVSICFLSFPFFFFYFV